MTEKIIHKLFVSPVFQFKIENYETLNKQLSEYIYDLKKMMLRVYKDLMLMGGIQKILKSKKIILLIIL